MLKIYAIIMLYFTINVILIVKSDDCALDSHSPNEERLLKRLEPLKNTVFTTNDNQYEYYFSVCTPLKDAEGLNQASVGILQKEISTNKTFIIGRYNDTDLEGGKKSIRVLYKNGDNYGTVCNKTSRMGAVSIVCTDDQEKNGSFTFIEENIHRHDCTYVFELLTSLICLNDSNKPSTTSTSSISPSSSNATKQTSTTVTASTTRDSKGLGAGSIMLIIVSLIFMVYLVGGVFYMRFVRKERGWQQIPNFEFWNKIGNLQADACNYICRCNNATRKQEAQPYESLSGNLSDDENMLNM